MSTYEWASMIAVLAGGFWVLAEKLNKIQVALEGKVGYKECHEKREKCPCVKDIENIKERIEK